MGADGDDAGEAPRLYGCACAAWACILVSYTCTTSGASLIARRFSALLASACFVKLNDPVMIVALSITMTLEWAMACWASIRGCIPVFARKVAALYVSVSLDLSSTARIFTPHLCASN